MGIFQFIKDQKEELTNESYFKFYTHCFDCGSKFIFKRDSALKKVCICQSNNWIIDRVVEC